jgi:uncharacterized membrane protein
MEPKRSKYDTNPLDPGVGERASNSFESTRPGPPTEEVRGGPTFEVGSHQGEVESYQSEAPTRMIDDQVTSYPSIFVPPKTREYATYDPPRVSYEKIYQPPPVPPPSVYQSPSIPVYQQRTTKVSGLGIPEKWAVTLPYLPFYLAIVISVIELLLVPRSESRTRFHASQALTLQIGITAISTILSLGSLFTDRWTGAGLFNIASVVFLIIAMVRVYKGKTLAIPPLDDWRKWLDEKIKPRKKAGL